MDSETLFSLLQAICHHDASHVRQLCENKQFTGNFIPSPLSLALHTHPLQTEIIRTLLQHGFQPSQEDYNYYQNLPLPLRVPDITAALASRKFSFRTIRSWFQNTSLSSSQLASLWEITFTKGDDFLNHYLLSKHSLLTTPSKRGLLLFAAKKGHPLIAETLVMEQTPPKQQGFWAKFTHYFSTMITHARYGHSAPHNKKALFAAAKNKQIEVAQILLKETNFIISEHDTNYLLARFFKEETTSTTIAPAKRGKLLETILQNKRIIIPIYWLDRITRLAATNGQVEAIKILLNLLFNPTNPSRYHRDPYYEDYYNDTTPTRFALWEGPEPIVKHIIDLAIENGHLELIKALLQDSRVDFTVNNNGHFFLWAAIKRGHLDIVTLLLKDPRIDPATYDNLSICGAAKNGHLDIVTLLLKDPRIDPAARNNLAICGAAKNGHLDIVTLLLKDPRIDPAAQNNLAICKAVENGHLDIVTLLLQDPRVDPTAQNNLAIRTAIELKLPHMAKLLLKDSRVASTVNILSLATTIIERENLNLLRVLLQTSSWAPDIHSDHSLFQRAAQKQDPAFIKLLLAFIPQEQLLSLLKESPSYLAKLSQETVLPEEIVSLRALLSLKSEPEQKHALKTFKAETFISLDTKQYIDCAATLHRSQTQEHFMKNLTTLWQQKEMLEPLKNNLINAAKTLFPLVRLAKEFPGTMNQPADLKMALYKPLIAPHLVPFLSKTSASTLFETLHPYTLPKRDHLKSSKEAVETLAQTQFDKALNSFAPYLYQCKNSLSWVNKSQSPKTGVGITNSVNSTL